MQSKISSKSLVLIACIGGLALFSIDFVSPALGLPVQDSYSKSTPSGDSQRVGLPVRIRIPKINLDAELESVGVTSEGAMDVPSDIRNAAWFNPGPRPGEKGSAVIDGHFGSKDGMAAVFRILYLLEKGDKVYVEDEHGAVTTFVVQGFRRYDPDADAVNVFGSDDGKAHLNLITCEGVWDEAEKTFSNRLVVFTDREMDEVPEVL